MNNKQVTLDIFHREDEKIEIGDIVATTTSEFNYNGKTHCFDQEAVEVTTVTAIHVGSNYDEYVAEKSYNGGCYGFDYYEVIDNDPIVEFEISYKEETVEGFLHVNEADDEAPIGFYDECGFEQSHYPTNPHKPATLHDQGREADFEHLKYVFQTTDFIQRLVNNADETGKEIILKDDDVNPVILVIN